VSYEDKIAALVAKHVTTRSRFSFMAPIAEALGCRTEDSALNRYEPDQPPVEDESLVAQTLLTMLESLLPYDAWSPDELSVLDGMCKNRRWEQCIQSPGHARLLAVILLRYTCVDGTVTATGQMRWTKNDVTAMRREWLKIDAPQPNVEQVARAMFGDPWWYFEVEEAGLAISQGAIPGLVQRTRPAFLPGLIPDAPQGRYEILPPLSGT
jgi:hypothetical protein